ncbi:MAG: formate-dependent phosphoribosylglycinamide formyltransferase [Litoricolaceae bacterium]|nr:formate-dependent phosphoribosylglycinamide formyltransferase [Litorivicinaceae bacterium]
MSTIGTPFTSTAKRALLCGSGELGKEVAIELQRLGIEVIALDSYANAPAMHVADRSHVLNMLDPIALRAVIESEQPHLIIPEIEAIATDTLVELETEGYRVIPTARATQLTMNRKGIRELAAKELGLKTSSYCFADSHEAYHKAVEVVGIPFVVKPIMSSSGKGQSIVRDIKDVEPAWDYAQSGGRARDVSEVIVESLIDFDYEITLLTIRHKDGVSFCDPIGHVQESGDYQQSWQPHLMSQETLQAAQEIADKVTAALCGEHGRGLLGVELFIKGEEVFFNEVSPRPHDTGLVTLISQDLSEFALHVRAILELPIPNITQHGFSASAVILPRGESEKTEFSNLDQALAAPDTQIRLFGKPVIRGKRRMGVALARGSSLEEALDKAVSAANAVLVKF